MCSGVSGLSKKLVFLLQKTVSGKKNSTEFMAIVAFRELMIRNVMLIVPPEHP